MAFTNQTPNYGLPQYIGTDKPSWLVDINGAMSNIDTGMNAAKTQAAAAETKADNVNTFLTGKYIVTGVTTLTHTYDGVETISEGIQALYAALESFRQNLPNGSYYQVMTVQPVSTFPEMLIANKAQILISKDNPLGYSVAIGPRYTEGIVMTRFYSDPGLQMIDYDLSTNARTFLQTNVPAANATGKVVVTTYIKQ